MEIIERFKQIINATENPFVIEFGGCDGFHSKLMLDIVAPKGNYIFHIFEPVTNLCTQIYQRIGQYANSNNNVKVFNEAINSHTGNTPFYQSGGEKIVNGMIMDKYYGSSSVRKPKLVIESWKEMTFVEQTCKSTTFDDYILREGLQERIIDFIWADIQGAEVDLILGGSEAFKNVRYFYTEYCDSELYEGEIGLNKILEMMPDFEMIQDYQGDVLLKNKHLH